MADNMQVEEVSYEQSNSDLIAQIIRRKTKMEYNGFLDSVTQLRVVTCSQDVDLWYAVQYYFRNP